MSEGVGMKSLRKRPAVPADAADLRECQHDPPCCRELCSACELVRAYSRIAELEAANALLKRFAAFARSCILCGESWSAEAQALFDTARGEER